MEFLLGVLVGIAIGLMIRNRSERGVSDSNEMTDEPRVHHDVGDFEIPKTHTAPVSASTTKRMTIDVASIDSVSVLLYFGAFLLVAGVGLFVGLSDYNGGVKTFAVSVLALTFYAAGLAMHRYIRRLRPAGMALTSIGLVCLPLAGAAAYFYLDASASGPFIWFTTSLVSLALYVYALWLIRQSLIGYMSVFMCLSMWLSIVAIVHAPIYLFGWAMIVLGMAYLLAAKFLHMWQEVEAPLSVSATVMVPTALIATILFGQASIDPVQQGITMLLAAGFYALMTWLEGQERPRRAYFALSYLLIPLGTAVIAGHLFDGEIQASFVVSAVAVLQLLVATVWRKTHEPWLKTALLIGAITLGLVTIISVPIFTNRWSAYAILLALNVSFCLFTGMWMRSRLHMILGLTGLLVLPAVVGYQVFVPELSALIMSAVYIVLAMKLMLVGRLLRSRGFVGFTMVSYFVALLVAWCTGLAGHEWVPMAVSIAVGLVGVLAAYYERLPYLVYAGTLLGVTAAAQGLNWQHSGLGSTMVLVVASLGLAYYVVGEILRHLKLQIVYEEAWILSGVATMFLSAMASLLSVGITWPAVDYLALSGVLVAYESWRNREHIGVYVGGAVALLALQLGLYRFGLREWQLYWYMWSAYSVAIAYLERLPGFVVASALPAAGGLVAMLAMSSTLAPENIGIAWSLLFVGYYMVGKLHLFVGSKQWKTVGQAWSYTGLVGLYVACTLPIWFGETLNGAAAHIWNALLLMLAGAFTCYETYVLRNKGGMYLGAAVTMVGLQWLIFGQHVYTVQIYTHMWALYFVVLAWLAYRDKQNDEKKVFVLSALFIQTVPLAWLALSGDTGAGLQLLLESIAIMLFGLWSHYRLVSYWGLCVAIGSVLYQLREFQFFVLALLGAGIIGLGVLLLLRQEKNKK